MDSPDDGLDGATRAMIMSLLSETDVARVSSGGGGSHLIEGDEYVDLEQLHDGVRRMEASGDKSGEFLPRNALADETWSRICARLVPPHVDR
jgi:hypothetical protein